MEIKNTNTQMEIAKKIAEKSGVSEEEFNDLYQQACTELEGQGLTEKQLKSRASKRIRGLLRRAQNNKLMSSNGFIIARFPNNDFAKIAWNKVENYIATYGIDKAEADGYVNEDGDFLYPFGFNKGQPIDLNSIYGSAYGIFENEKGDYEGRFVSIGNYVIKENREVPIGTEATIRYKEADKKDQKFEKNMIYFDSATVLEPDYLYDENEIDNLVSTIKNIFGKDIMYDDYEELCEFLEKESSDKFNLGCIPATCIDIGVRDDPTQNIPLTFEVGEDEFGLPTDTITFWCDPGIFRGLNVQFGLDGLLLVHGRMYKEELRLDICGFIPQNDVDLD